MMPMEEPRWLVTTVVRGEWTIATAKAAATKRGCRFEGDKAVKGPAHLRHIYEGLVQNVAAIKKLAAEWENKGHLWRARRSTEYADVAISNLHAADAHLIQLLPSRLLKGEIPRVLSIVRDYLPPDDERRRRLKEKFSGRTKVRCLTGTDRTQISSALRGAYVANGYERGRVRTFYSILLRTSLTLLAIALVLAVLNIVVGPTMLTCFDAAGTRPVCPLGADENRYDVLLIEFVGGSAAMIGAVQTISRMQRIEDPYALHVAQALIKVSLGTLTAVFGLLLIYTLPRVIITDSWNILAAATVFGYGQELFTHFVDKKADALRRAALPRAATQLPSEGSDPPRGQT
ncbi:hypothetical protein GCM10009535_37480 [Streptomyces thermocarboxydovorans]|uniref:Uncharacterized protein n=1 Tax=Streptomyces thermocarboxydovorans TaxID=59298 RepID=A0ABN1HJS3_9ACTN